MGVLNRDPQFATFVKVLHRAGANKVLSSKEAFTVVVPDQTSFDGMDRAKLSQLLHNRTAAEDFVDRHLLVGRVTISAMMSSPRSTLTSRGGDQVPVTFNGSKVTIGGAKVIKYDIEAKNGLIDVVDGPVS